MRRLAMGLMSVAMGLGSLSFVHAQAEPTKKGRTGPWSWLTNQVGAAPTKPSADANPSPPVPSKATAPHVLRQTTCNIPFTVDAAKTTPVELHLYVSQDRGANWKYYAKAQPADGHFSFRASHDGEFWFALRSVDKAVAPADLKQLTPGLKVIFDTRDPELRFDATLNDLGEVRATWVVRDPTLVAESLKVEFQAHAKAPWQLVSVPFGKQERDGSLVGNYSWTPTGTVDGLLVRAEVSDQAGHKTVVSRRLTSRVAANGVTQDGFHPRTGPATTYPIAQETQSWPADNRLPAKAPAAAVSPHGDLPPPKPSATGVPPTGGRESVRNPYISANQVVTKEREAGSGPELHSSTAGEEEITGIAGPSNQVLPSNQGLPSGLSETPSPPAVASPTRSVPDEPRSEGAPSEPAVPHGERPRMTNARQFSLDYEIDSLGPAGVAQVQLWGTNDGGRNWKHWQDDEDRRSPMDVVVDKDGIFGFRIVILGSNQLAGAPPQPGDPADLWVGVDTTLPTVRLTSAIYGDGEHVGQLDIRWQAIDVWFSDRPITLQFSEHPQGPWSTIAAGLPNNGQFFWAVEPRIPRHIYLRIEARDEAGNVAEHQIQEAISTGGLVPQGRIRGIRSTVSPPADDRSAARQR